MSCFLTHSVVNNPDDCLLMMMMMTMTLSRLITVANRQRRQLPSTNLTDAADDGQSRLTRLLQPVGYHRRDRLVCEK